MIFIYVIHNCRLATLLENRKKQKPQNIQYVANFAPINTEPYARAPYKPASRPMLQFLPTFHVKLTMLLSS